VLFVSLVRLRGKIDEELAERANRFLANPPPGVKIHNVLYTLGRYDIVIFYEAPSEKDALSISMMFSDKESIETLVAIPREEAIKLFKK